MKNIKNILERLKDVYAVPNNRQLANKIDVNYNTMATWIKRDIIPYEKLHELVQKEQLSFDWLLSGVGVKYRNQPIQTTKMSIENEETDKDFLLFFYQYHFFNENPTVGVIINNPYKIYGNNPLLTFMLHDGENVEDNMILVKLQFETQITSFDLRKISNLELFTPNDKTPITVIIKNNLFKKNYPIYDNEYIGAMWFLITQDEENIELTTYSAIDEVLHTAGLTISREEFLKLTIVGVEKNS
jgi:hypothetical protein